MNQNFSRGSEWLVGALTVALVACGGEAPAPRSGGERVGAAVEEIAAAGGSTGSSSCTACGGNAGVDVLVWGNGLRGWDRKQVHAAALEFPVSGLPKRVGTVSTTIHADAFTLFCPTALTENYNYPSWAAYVDLDGDG